MTIFEVGTWQGLGISLVFGILGMVGLAIKGLFIYFAKYLAPQDRIINSMVKYDQVRKVRLYSLNMLQSHSVVMSKNPHFKNFS